MIGRDKELRSWQLHVQARFSRGFTLDLSIESDTRPLVLIGPNGSGKSTTLRLLASALNTSSIEMQNVKVCFQFDQEVLELKDVRPHARGIAWLPQNASVFPHLSVLENLRFGHDVQHQTIEQKVLEEKLEELGLHADQQGRELSGGEARKLALARALITPHHLLLLDEPLANLDPIARQELSKMIRHAPSAVVLATHDIRLVESLEMPRVVALHRGAPFFDGSLSELRAASIARSRSDAMIQAEHQRFLRAFVA